MRHFLFNQFLGFVLPSQDMVSTSSAINLRKSEKYHFGAGHTGRGERHAPPPPPPPPLPHPLRTFLRSKKKKGEQREKIKTVTKVKMLLF